MTILEKQGVAAKLRELGVDKSCPRCNSFNFEVVGEAPVLLIKEENRKRILDLDNPKAIASIIVACSKCGFLTFHARCAIEGLL